MPRSSMMLPILLFFVSFESKNTVMCDKKEVAHHNDMNYSKYFCKMQYIFQKKLDFFEVFCGKTTAFPVILNETSFFLLKSLFFS